MAALYGGVYRRLKDRQSSLKDKLKLTRFAWRSDRVYIPNKQQVLIDFLCGLLLNKKKNHLSEDDASLVWQCLCEILQTKQVQVLDRHSKTLIVKPSICQVLIDSLCGVGNRLHAKNDLGHMIGCCHGIIKSPRLSYIFTTKYDYMIGLVSALTQIAVKHTTEGKLCSKELLDLLAVSAQIYKGCQRAQPNQKLVLQQVTSKLFVPVVTLWGLTREKNNKDIEASADVLLTILEDGFFNSDHHVSYNMYLSIICGEGETKSQPPKVIENIFNTITDVLGNKNASKLAQPDVLRCQMLKYLPTFFKGFLNHKCADDIGAHRLFLHTCSLLGVKLNSGDLCELAVDSDVLGVITQLLKAVQQCKVYNIARDNNSGGQQLQTYKGILLVVINSARSGQSFTCLQELLSMNHLILEPKLSFVLCYCCVPDTKSDTEVVREADKFLLQLISTYGRLHQVPKWIEKFSKTLGDTSVKLESFQWLKQFTDRFSEVVQALPQSSTADILETLVQKLQQYFLPSLVPGTMDDTSYRKLSCMTVMVHEYMMNMRVADYSITDTTLNKVKDTLTTLKTNILKPLLEMCLQRKTKGDLLFSSLLLCYSWGEVELLLSQYTKLETGCHLSSESDGVISLVHHYWESEKWIKLEKLLEMCDDKRAAYVQDLLTWQSARAVILDHSLAEDSRHSLVEKLVTKLFSVGHCDQTTDASWDFMLQSVTVENYTLARWSLLTELLPVVSGYLSDSTAGLVARYVVKCTLCRNSPKSSDMMTSSEVSRRVLEGHILTQNNKLLSAIISAVWTNMEDIIIPKSTSPKKRKKIPGPLTSVLSLLGDDTAYRNQAVDSKQFQQIQDVARHCHDMLQVDVDFSISCDQSVQISRLLQVLSAVPIEFLSAVDRLRCIMGLMILLHVLMGSKSRQLSGVPETTAEPVTKCIELLCVNLESSARAPVFQVLGVEISLEWLHKMHFQSKESQDIHNIMCLLLELSCRVIVQDYQSLRSLVFYVKKIKQNYSDMLATLKKTKLGQVIEDKKMVVLLTSSLILQEVDQVVGKAYLKEDIRDICKQLMTQLSHLTHMILSQFVKCKSDLPLSLIRGYTSVVKHCSTREFAAEMKAEVLNNFDYVLQWSIKVLSGRSADYSSYSEALHFLSVICVCHKDLSDVFTQQHRTVLWDILMGLLSDIMSPQQSSKFSSNVSEKEASNLMTDDSHQSLDSTVHQQTENICFRDSGITNDLGNVDVFKGIKDTDWRTMKRTLLYSGALDKQWARVVFTQSQGVMAALIASCDIDNFRSVIRSILTSLSVECVYTGLRKMQSVLYAWQQLLKFDLSEEQGKTIAQAVKNLMSNFQLIMQEIQYADNLTGELAVPVLITQVRMLEFGQVLMSPQTALLALHSCQFAKLDGHSFVPAFHAVYEVLNALLIHHTNSVYGAIPSFISCTKRLMKTVIINSDQDGLSQNKDETDKLIGCAVLFDRLCQLISTHKVDFGKVAVYMVADYVSLVQQVTLLPAVKRALVPGIYKLLDLCDKYSISQLHTVLSQGVKEVFKVLYADYTKYFKYHGRT